MSRDSFVSAPAAATSTSTSTSSSSSSSSTSSSSAAAWELFCDKDRLLHRHAEIDPGKEEANYSRQQLYTHISSSSSSSSAAAAAESISELRKPFFLRGSNCRFRNIPLFLTNENEGGKKKRVLLDCRMKMYKTSPSTAGNSLCVSLVKISAWQDVINWRSNRKRLFYNRSNKTHEYSLPKNSFLMRHADANERCLSVVATTTNSLLKDQMWKKAFVVLFVQNSDRYGRGKNL